MKKVAFICVHNSCRSQIAEALGKHLASDVFESYSAGTETKPRINQDAVRLMKAKYGIDMEKEQYSKLLSDIPPVDVVVTISSECCDPSVPNNIVGLALVLNLLVQLPAIVYEPSEFSIHLRLVISFE